MDPVVLRESIHVVSDRFAQAAENRELWTTSAHRSKVFWRGVYVKLLGQLGLSPTDELAGRLYAEFTDLANYRAFPDVRPALERLRTAGLALGVVSNFEEWLERLLESVGLTPFLLAQNCSSSFPESSARCRISTSLSIEKSFPSWSATLNTLAATSFRANTPVDFWMT